MDDELSALVSLLIHKYPGDRLRLKAGYLSCCFGAETSRALASSTTLKEMDLSQIQLSGRGLISFFRTVASKNTILEDLYFNFFEEIDEKVCDALQEMIASTHSLRRLTLRVRLFDRSTVKIVQKALEKGLEQNSTIQELNFEIVPQYQLSLLLDSSHMRHSCSHQIDRGTIDMRLALNTAGVINPSETTKGELLEMLTITEHNSSAQYYLLRTGPHIWGS